MNAGQFIIMYKDFSFSIKVDFFAHFWKCLICTLISMTNTCCVYEHHECVHQTTVCGSAFELLSSCGPQLLQGHCWLYRTFSLSQLPVYGSVFVEELRSSALFSDFIIDLNQLLSLKVFFVTLCIKGWVSLWKCLFLCVSTCIYSSKFLFSFHFYTFMNLFYNGTI